METYKDFRTARQEAFNKLPIFWAFSNKQLEEALAKRGFTMDDAGRVLYRFGNGGFYLKTDSETVKAFFARNWEGELHDLMEGDNSFAEDAFEYEMLNHEYPINWQGDWDVVSCFGTVEYDECKDGADYLRELGYGDGVVKAYARAARKVQRSFDW